MRPPRTSVAGLLGAVGIFAVGFFGLMNATSPWAGLVYSGTLLFLAVGPIAVVYRRGERRAFWVGFSLWGWAYLALTYGPGVHPEVYPHLVTTRLLNWSYPWLIPEDRNPSGPAQALQIFDIPSPTFGEGIDSQMTGVNDFDVMTKGNGGKLPSLLAEGVVFAGISRTDNEMPRIRLRVRRAQFEKLSRAQSDGVSLVLNRHRPNPFAAVWSSPPVQLEDFERIGQALCGLLIAWAGGLVARYFHSTGDSALVGAAPGQ